MKKISLLLVGLLCLLLIGCTNVNVEIIPEMSTKVSSIGDEDYNKLSVIKELKDAKREDFKTFEFTFLLGHSDTVENRQIKIHVDWNETGERLNGARSIWYGISSEQDIESKNSLEYKQEVIFYAKGLSEENIKEAFNDAYITVEWNDFNQERKSKEYNIADLIELNKK